MKAWARVILLVAFGGLLWQSSHAADALELYLGRWEGVRDYQLKGLAGRETFTMEVTRFRKTGLKMTSEIARSGWDRIYVTEFFYPRGRMAGRSGYINEIHDLRSGNWQIRRGKIFWRWKMRYDGLREWTKSSTTWSIDAQGRLQEVRFVPKQKNSRGGRVTATATRMN